MKDEKSTKTLWDLARENRRAALLHKNIKKKKKSSVNSGQRVTKKKRGISDKHILSRQKSKINMSWELFIITTEHAWDRTHVRDCTVQFPPVLRLLSRNYDMLTWLIEKPKPKLCQSKCCFSSQCSVSHIISYTRRTEGDCTLTVQNLYSGRVWNHHRHYWTSTKENTRNKWS